MQNRPLEHDSSVQRHKIAIPRLDCEPFLPPESNKRKLKDRTSRACKACRKRKIKCSGDVPICKSCHAAESACVYEQSRRNRLREATNLNHTLASLLKKLSDRANDEEKQEIIDALEDAEDDILSQTTEASLKPSGNLETTCRWRRTRNQGRWRNTRRRCDRIQRRSRLSGRGFDKNSRIEGNRLYWSKL